MRGGQQQQQPNSAFDAFLLFAFIVAIFIGLWYAYSPQIVRGVFAIRTYEADVAAFIAHKIDALVSYFGGSISIDEKINLSLKKMAHANPDKLTYKQFFSILSSFGEILVIPFLAMGFVFAFFLLFRSRISRYRSTYTMSTLSGLEVANWPEITPTLGKGLIKNSLDEGPWAMSIQPMDFAKKYNLVKEETKNGKSLARLHRGAAYRVFASQLGPLWTGLEGLPAYVLALFAIFAAKSQNDSDAARKLLHQIARSSKSGKLNFGGTRELLVKHVRAKEIGRAVGPHAYLYTVMSSMLDLARTDGVLANAEFLWLKPIDRRLWYVLSSVGRQTPFPEVSGVFAHWIVEKRLRRPLKVPMVEIAVDGLEQALGELIYNPEE